MRIIHCFRSPVGGIFRHVRDLIEEHVAAGHEVGILCDSSTGGELEDKLFKEIEPLLALGLTRIPIRRAIRPSDILAIWDSYSEIKELKPDVIHGHGAKGGVIARLVGTMLRAGKHPVVRLYSPHGGSLHYDRKSLKGRLIFLIERMLERMTDAICFVCDYEKRTYFEKIAHPLPLYRTIYNGVGESEFEPIALVDSPRDFLYIGMMRDLKGPQIFIEAMRILIKEQGLSVTAHMVGDGPDQQRYRDLASDLGLNERVMIHGALPARQAFSLAKCVVVPSLAEAMPYIVLEACAAQKPIIASKVGGIPEILSDKSPSLVPSGDALALSDHMKAFLDEPQFFGMDRAEQENFKAKFSSRYMAQSMMKLYEQLLKRATDPKL